MLRHSLLALLLLVLLPLPVRAADGALAPLAPDRTAAELPLHTGPLTPQTPLRSRSGLTVWGLEAWLSRKHPAMAGTAAAFLAAERRYRINARALVAIAGGESGWGTSWIARNKRNLFGFGALHRDPTRYAVSFPSLDVGIDHVARFIDRHYLRPGGKYANGPTLAGMMRKWAPAGSWARLVSRVSRGINPPDPLTDLDWGHPEIRLTSDALGAPLIEVLVPVSIGAKHLPDPAALPLCLLLADGGTESEPICTPGQRLGPGDARIRWALPLRTPIPRSALLQITLADQGGVPLRAQPESFGPGILGRIDAMRGELPGLGPITPWSVATMRPSVGETSTGYQLTVFAPLREERDLGPAIASANHTQGIRLSGGRFLE